MPTKTPSIKTLQAKIKKLERSVSIANDGLEAALSLSPETDNNFFTKGLSGLYEGRNAWDRKKIFAESLRAWRVNPIARRIVRLMRSFILGKGVTIKADNEEAQTFLTQWWRHPLNDFDRNIKRWKDEEVRTGNLFFLYTVTEDGMTYVRAVPAEQIDEIITKDNDIEQETDYIWKSADGAEEKTYPAYNPEAEQKTFMLHYASNQPVGSPWGEADLSPLLVWIGRFSSWLEDRVRLNRFRTAFMYVIRGRYKNEAERKTREMQIRANPPKSGDVLVLGLEEDWGIMSANLDAFDASMDGLNIKKNIAAGIGFPLHWLAEPESATRTTAEAAGTPTFRTLEEAQSDFFDMLISMARVALAVKNLTADKITIEGPDITERDNASLALAMARAFTPLAEMYDRELIDENELKGITFRMMAEPFEGNAPKAKRKPLTAPGAQGSGVESVTDPSDPKEEAEE